MDTLINIFKSLGVDQTVFIQFGIVVVLYFILTTLFFGKLQFVIETRDNKTTKREGNANKMLAEAEALAEKYKKTIDEAHSEAINQSTKKKNALAEKNKEQYKAKVSQIEAALDEARARNQEEIESRRQQVMSNADSLSKELLTKLSK